MNPPPRMFEWPTPGAAEDLIAQIRVAKNDRRAAFDKADKARNAAVQAERVYQYAVTEHEALCTQLSILMLSLKDDNA